MYDYLIVGAGLFGAVFAHEAAAQGKICLVIDKRPHITGNINGMMDIIITRAFNFIVPVQSKQFVVPAVDTPEFLTRLTKRRKGTN
ncbi:MAG: NAD(P)-binding protein [Treponema sp.]|jgi:NADPH-dependent 2,4-dienoyl-CoA reductase/sulfur reductase-like enzyme|nr:NAD(P)-binding protein [Treponema sp.]